MEILHPQFRKTKDRHPGVLPIVSPEKHFIGKPCRRCSSTLRYLVNRGCVACSRHMSMQRHYANLEASKVKGKEYREKNPGSWRRAHLKRAYGLTLEAFNKIFEDQGRACAICGTTTPSRSGKGWHVDHDHVSGEIRGILCHPCNLTLGHAKDDIERLSGCIAYLKRTSRPT